jgi:hypothetical protein
MGFQELEAQVHLVEGGCQQKGVKAYAQFQAAINPEWILKEPGPAPSPPASQVQASHESGQDSPGGVGCRPQDQLELARPKDFIDETRGAGEKE